MSLTDEQKKIRSTGIGGSEIAAVVGLSPYANAWDVYAAKTGLRQETPETIPQKRGRLLEDAVAQWYAEETGAVLERCSTVRHPTSTIALATPDRIAQLGHDRRLLEIKTARLGLADQWGESGTDEIPQQYLVQVQYTMACVGLASADVAVLIAGDDFRTYHFQADTELQAMLIGAAERFWWGHVSPLRPPDVDGSDACREWLRRRHPRAGKNLLPASADAERLARELMVARAQFDLAEGTKKRLENELKALIGDAGGLVGDGWKIAWNETKGRAVTDWHALCEALKVDAATVEKFTTRKPARQFRPSGPLFKNGEATNE